MIPALNEILVRHNLKFPHHVFIRDSSAIPVYIYLTPILDFLIEGPAHVSNTSWYGNDRCGFRDRNF